MIKKILLMMSGLLVAALISEGLLRILAPRLPRLYNFVNVKREALTTNSLKQFLKFEGVAPHRDWRGYYTNSWGMNDEEFSEERGEIRILALGDSQSYGMVPFPFTNLTIAEKQLNTRCVPKQVSILNAGMPGAGILEYKKFFELAGEDLKPNYVLINLYLGNDVPDSYRKKPLLYPVASGINKSYLYCLIKNVLTSWQAGKKKSESLDPVIAKKQDTLNGSIRGGMPSGSEVPLSDNHPLLKGPTFADKNWQKIARDELNTLYLRNDAVNFWRPTLQALDQTLAEISRIGARPLFVFFPSEAQVYPEVFEEHVEYAKAYYGDNSLTAEIYDRQLPNKILEEFCKERQLPCLDLTGSLFDPHVRTFIYRDTHLNIHGNKLAGTAIADFIAGFVCN